MLAFGLALEGSAQGVKTKNVVLITTDGVRWQEVFRGVEESLMTKENGGVRDTNALQSRFGRATLEERREALFPFLWGTVAKHGQLFGNVDKGCRVRVTNGRNFSYPGYNELLCGLPDERIVSNSKLPNPNTNVLEWLQLHPAFRGKVCAFVNWEVIPWILNGTRSQIPMWSGFPLPSGALPEIGLPPSVRSTFDRLTPIWKDVVYDGVTSEAALAYVKSNKPRVCYVGFGETDEWAHEGRYDLYLAAAHHVDRFAADLWKYFQSNPAYRDQTTLIVTTDHGRGVSPTRWKSHGAEIEESGFVWVGIVGPDTPPMGERGAMADLTQSQVAATVAAALGEDFRKGVSNAASSLPAFGR